jgi:glycosyltransferase involved in cell wall biosynthesis
MNDQPLVSAIIIFFNPGRYFEEAIESVFAQTYQNWELLLCDDGSTDGSTAIARQCAERFPEKVRYLEHAGHENRGMSATRNLGLRHARGEYVSWLDADDVWVPHKLERQVELSCANPEAAMVYGPLRLWFSWTGKDLDLRRDFIQDIGVPPNTLLQPPQLLVRFLQNDMHIPSGVLIRRAVLEEIGGYEEAFRYDYEDVIVHSKVCLKWPVFASGESWYNYRQHDSSCCAESKRTGRERDRRQAFLNRLADYLREQGHPVREVWQVVQDELEANRPTLRNTLTELKRRGVEEGKRGIHRSLWLARKVADRIVPQFIRSLVGLWLFGQKYSPPPGWAHFGNFRRVTPISRVFGWDRGSPVDRYYIEQFLAAHASDIRGRVLEIGDRDYTLKFGGARVTQSDVLHTRPGNSKATLIGDLSTGEGVPEEAFDCIILTQVLPFIYDFQAAIANIVRALKPGGVLLVTLPGISQISRYDAERWGDFWRFTSLSVRRLFAEHFEPEHVKIQVYGNVLAAIAFLQGLAAHELRPDELDYADPDYEMIIALRAAKPHEGGGEKP